MDEDIIGLFCNDYDVEEFKRSIYNEEYNEKSKMN
jgi:hypothetical protein